MVNKNYRRGFDAEKKCLNLHLDNGWWAERSYASKGTFDLIAMKKGGFTRFIQVKRSQKNIVSEKALINKYKEDIDKIKLVPSIPTQCKEIWIWIDPQTGSKSGTWRRLCIYEDSIEEVMVNYG